MTQLTIEINDNKALKLIEDLEDLKLIKVLRGKTNEKPSIKNLTLKTNDAISKVKTSKKLSERLAGSLSESQAKKLDRELEKIRGEWQRGI